MADSRQHSMVEDKSCKASWVLSFETHRALLLPHMPVKKRHKTNQPTFKGWWNALHFWKRGAAKNLFYSLLSGHNYLHSLHMQNYSTPLKTPKKSHPITAFQNQYPEFVPIFNLPPIRAPWDQNLLKKAARTLALLVINLLDSITSPVLCTTSSSVDTVFLQLLTSCFVSHFFPHICLSCQLI